jgi:hypothetical protein
MRFRLEGTLIESTKEIEVYEIHSKPKKELSSIQTSRDHSRHLRESEIVLEQKFGNSYCRLAPKVKQYKLSLCTLYILRKEAVYPFTLLVFIYTAVCSYKFKDPITQLSCY